MAVPVEDGSLLHGPTTSHSSPPTRVPSSYKPLSTFALSKSKQYQQQYGDMYFLRLTSLKKPVEEIASAAWDGFQISGEEHWISAPPPRRKYLSGDGEDEIMLEDESGRLRLIGGQLSKELLVTGCIVAVMGTENANGDFEVVDIKVPDLPPQEPRWEISGEKEEEDTDMDTGKAGRKKIALVSGLSFSGTSAENSLEKALLTEYLLGESLDPSSQADVSKISRLIIAGNSIASDLDSIAHDTVGNTRKAQKKYGYDASAFNPAPTTHFDNFLTELLPSLPITLLPGPSDPANASLPQQPIHPAMFPQARAYCGSAPSVIGEEREAGWFDTVTNPWEGEIEGWRVLGTGGQNVDDVFKYVEGEDRLRMMEAMWSYPFQDADPFIINTCPHIFFAGNQPSFDTASIEGPDGQTVRLISIPSFEETGEIVLLDAETLEAEVVRITVE
ncbi:putative dna polymerase delta small subunit protein [Botrytis cinerea BcDW1]|uniref:Putative dna polymerase delta small subunit protein n=1 Tax=Botryotinia fuckeliana (strain BcDW1) TaxID=1290391 RepID=M7TLH9_BOTF1|nr:putative dna polymerase delta small subunit protein [Botrytis cinerea BcDW1]